MLDLRFYATQHLGGKAEYFLKYFGKNTFQSTYALKRFLDNQDNISWITKDEIRNEMGSIFNVFSNSLETERNNQAKQTMAMLLSKIDISSQFPEFQFKAGSTSTHDGICPKCGKKELFVPNHGASSTLVCNRKDKCGYSSSIFKYLQEYRKMNSRDAFKELAELAGVDLESYQTSLEKHTDISEVDYLRARKVAEEIVVKAQEIEYEYMDLTRPYKEIEVSQVLPHYHNMNLRQKFMLVVSGIYSFSKKTKQEGKIKYLQSRSLDKVSDKFQESQEELGYISKKDINNLTNLLVKTFGKEDLIEFGILNDKDLFKHHTEEGFIVIPNRDIYSNMITGLKLRNIKLAEWQSNSFKEVEMSFKRIANPLPNGITREALIDKSYKFRFFEGRMDRDSIPYPTEGKWCDVAIAGTNGIDEKQLGFFKDRIVYICFDQDIAGQKGAEALKVKLEKAGATVVVVKWGVDLGLDVNEVLKNGNIDKITKRFEKQISERPAVDTISSLIASVKNTQLNVFNYNR